MTASDRIPCMNPRCRRTAPAAKHGPGAQIVCGKCWRNLPHTMRSEYAVLRRRARRIRRLIDRRVAAGSIRAESTDRAWHHFSYRWNALWTRIRNYFVTPEQPIGLDGFLREVGLA